MRMSITSTKAGVGVAGHFEPGLTHQLLRGCRNCGSPHPIALRAPDETICPGCGQPAEPPSAPRTERAVLSGVPLARLFLWIGEKLAALAAKIRNG